MRRLLLATAAAAAACGVPAQAQAQAPNPPELLVVLSVDQLGADLFDAYRPHFTGGLRRLSGGTVFRNGYQGQAATETCPGHSTILTGALPARTGIIANSWIDQSIAREDKTVYCAEDETAPGTTSKKYEVSAAHLKVPTLGDILKTVSPDSRNVAIAGKDRSAVMMSGHSPDQRWYWSNDRFVTDLDGAPAPSAIRQGNEAIAKLIATAEPALVPPPLCAGKAQPYTLPGGHSVGSGRFARAAGDVTAFKISPSLDGATLALAAALVREMKLGQDRAPDILSVGLAATDYVGHAYGSGGEEMCLNLLALDRELGDFLQALDAMGIDYAVALTSDHGGEDLPERVHAAGTEAAARIDPALDVDKLGAVIAQGLRLPGPVLLGGPSGDVWIDDSLSPAQQQQVEAEALRIYRAHPQVEAVFTRTQVQAVPLPSGAPDTWTLLQRVRASFDPERSGDLIVLLKPRVSPIAEPGAGYVATHGSAWDYDRRVPILFWSPASPSATREEAVGTVDLMPTLAAMIGIPLTSVTIDGQCLQGVARASCPPR